MSKVYLDLTLNVSIEEDRAQEFVEVIRNKLYGNSAPAMSFSDLSLMGASIHGASVITNSPGGLHIDVSGRGLHYQLTGDGRPLQDVIDEHSGDHWPQDER